MNARKYITKPIKINLSWKGGKPVAQVINITTDKNGDMWVGMRKLESNIGYSDIARPANIPSAYSTLENLESCKCHNG